MTSEKGRKKRSINPKDADIAGDKHKKDTQDRFRL